MEAAGAVFLPAAGCLYDGEMDVDGVDEYGDYWSSTAYEDENEYAYLVGFASDGLYPANGGGRGNGYSVRLVKVVE